MPRHLATDLASTRHVTPSGTGQPVDTVQVQAGQTVLLMEQSVRAYNGLYTASEGQWERHPDLVTAGQMEAGTTFYVRGGAEHARSEFYLQDPVAVVDSDGLYFARRSYRTAVRDGAGLEIDEMNATIGLPEQYGVQGEYLNPRVEVDARGVVSYAESTGVREDLLEGLRPRRLSSTSVEVSGGRAWIPGANAGEGGLLEVDFPITKSGLVLPPSSVVFMYLWGNGSFGPDVEFSTQVPDSPYYGAGRTKGGPNNTDPNSAPDETRRLIGQLQTDSAGGVFGVLAHDAEAWIAPTLLNGWVNFGAPLETAGYHKDPGGYVHLKGAVKNGTGSVPVLRLPAGYRPASEKVFAAKTDSTTSGRVDVEPDGDVVLQLGTNGYLSLAGISFRAEI